MVTFMNLREHPKDLQVQPLALAPYLVATVGGRSEGPGAGVVRRGAALAILKTFWNNMQRPK
jgi:hypothetical protein